MSADDTGNLVLRIQNAGKAEISGFELEIQARPVDNMDIIGSVGYTDFEITELDAGVSDFTIDTEAVKTPKWNASLGVQYTWELNAGNLLSFRADGSYQGKTYQDIQNTEIIASAAHSIFNARLVYDNFDSNWQVALFVTNLTDKRYITNGFQTLTSFGLANVIYGRPRELGLSFKKSF
jgi:iron complex outermembrane receptor protein